nr:hypothetical protein BgiMline_027012 [Biomphalaria glabrata]
MTALNMKGRLLLFIAACLACACAETCYEGMDRCRDTYYATPGTITYLQNYYTCVEKLVCTYPGETDQKDALLQALKNLLENNNKPNDVAMSSARSHDWSILLLLAAPVTALATLRMM